MTSLTTVHLFDLDRFFVAFERLSNALIWQTFPLESRDYLSSLLAELEAHTYQLREEQGRMSTDLDPGEQSQLNSLIADFSESLKSLRNGMGSQDESLFFLARNSMERSFHDLFNKLAGDSIDKALTSGFSENKSLNYFMHVAKSENSEDREGLNDIFLWYSERFKNDCRNFRRMLKAAPSYPELKPKLESLMPLYLDAKEAFGELSQFLFSKGNCPLDAIFDRLRKFADPYGALCIKIAKDFEEKTRVEEEKILRIRCPRCGKSNVSASPTCGFCAFKFPRSAEANPNISSFEIGEGTPCKRTFAVTTNMQRVLEAVEDFQDGEIDRNEFTAVLDWIENLLSEGRKGLAEFQKNPPEIYRVAPETRTEIVELFNEGILEMETAVGCFKSWRDSAFEEQQLKGIQLFLSGGEKIYHSMSMGQSIEHPVEQPPLELQASTVNRVA